MPGGTGSSASVHVPPRSVVRQTREAMSASSLPTLHSAASPAATAASVHPRPFRRGVCYRAQPPLTAIVEMLTVSVSLFVMPSTSRRPLSVDSTRTALADVA